MSDITASYGTPVDFVAYFKNFRKVKEKSPGHTHTNTHTYTYIHTYIQKICPAARLVEKYYSHGSGLFIGKW